MSSYCITLFDTLENPAESDSCFVTATKNFTINKGSSYRITFVLSKNSNPVDLSGYSLRGTIKPSSSSSTIWLNMTMANKLLKIDNDNSSIIMYLTESFTRSVSSNFGIYDIELISPSAEVNKIVNGLITFVNTTVV